MDHPADSTAQLCRDGKGGYVGREGIPIKVGRLKPPPVLTSRFNWLKPPRSICQKVVNTGQYESEWSIKNFKGHFCGGLRYLYRFYVLSIEKGKKYCFVPTKGTYHGDISMSTP